mmetsp:Transcript_21620/g.30291  ORF Transcript_21620/g.30291 Transcript_21620/m.30291 type:complete len:239 (+) Transcript_21620:629-1345(+)
MILSSHSVLPIRSPIPTHLHASYSTIHNLKMLIPYFPRLFLNHIRELMSVTISWTLESIFAHRKFWQDSVMNLITYPLKNFYPILLQKKRRDCSLKCTPRFCVLMNMRLVYTISIPIMPYPPTCFEDGVTPLFPIIYPVDTRIPTDMNCKDEWYTWKRKWEGQELGGLPKLVVPEWLGVIVTLENIVFCRKLSLEIIATLQTIPPSKVRICGIMSPSKVMQPSYNRSFAKIASLRWVQ